MGTGKTEQLLRELPNYNVVIAISSRRSFADEFSKKMGFVNYQSITDK